VIVAGYMVVLKKLEQSCWWEDYWFWYVPVTALAQLFTLQAADAVTSHDSWKASRHAERRIFDVIDEVRRGRNEMQRN
jgi:hypothetical protein